MNTKDLSPMKMFIDIQTFRIDSNDKHVLIVFLVLSTDFPLKRPNLEFETFLILQRETYQN